MKRAVEVLTVAVLALGCGSAIAGPEQIRLTWQGATDTTMTVTWRSADPTGVVEYGTDTTYGATQAAVSTPYQGSYLHVAELKGLTPASTYHYRCGLPSGWSSDASFRTAPPRGPDQGFHFVAWGDSRSDDAARARDRAAVQAADPDFSILTGDLVDDGANQAEWDQWFRTMQPLSAVSPMMASYGNHEANSPKYFAQFPLPKHTPSTSQYDDRAYYSFDYGNTHFVSLSSEPVGGVGGPQWLWLKEDLARASVDPNIRWIVAYAHRPPYSSSSHGSNLEVQNAWVPLFETYGVDVTFWGHDHNYERTKPMFQHQPAEQGGVTYIVAGGAGAPLYNAGNSAFTAFSRSVYHYVDVKVTGTEMHIEARDTGGVTFDKVTLTKPAAKAKWALDGKPETNVRQVATAAAGPVRSLWTSFDGRFLYVAAEGATTTNDNLLFVSPTAPGAAVAAPWKKAGSVWPYAAVLGVESANKWAGWRGPDGSLAPHASRASNPPGEVVEGIIDLQAKFGSIPKSVYVAAAAYGTADGAALVGQVPGGDGNGDLDAGEWVEVSLDPAQWGLGQAPGTPAAPNAPGANAGGQTPEGSAAGTGTTPPRVKPSGCASTGASGLGGVPVALALASVVLRRRRR